MRPATDSRTSVTEALARRLPKPCHGCGQYFCHYVTCPRAFVDGLRVECVACQNHDVEQGHTCPTPERRIAQGRLHEVFFSRSTGLRVFLEDGSHFVEDADAPGGWRELPPVPRTFRAAIVGR